MGGRVEARSDRIGARASVRVGAPSGVRVLLHRGAFGASGCLTSKSEERETWTAGSLRPPVSEPFGGSGLAVGRDFGGTRF